MCHENLFEKNNENNQYLRYREYNRNAQYLTYANENFKKTFSNIQDVIHHVIKKKSYVNNIQTYIKTVLEVSINVNFNCEIHKNLIKEYMYDFSSRFFLFNWCKSTNKLLDGTSKVYEDEDYIQREAFVYYNKRKKSK